MVSGATLCHIVSPRIFLVLLVSIHKGRIEGLDNIVLQCQAKPSLDSVLQTWEIYERHNY